MPRPKGSKNRVIVPVNIDERIATVKPEIEELSLRDLDLLTIGMVNDLYAESRNDEHQSDYSQLATQENFDSF
jgi:hypothetical protein